MKKFLLVLSCCLATWCSVLAGPKSSPEISMMQASAPAAAPAPTYPAVINSASLKNGVVTVSFTVNSGSTVSFNLEATGKESAKDVFTKSVSSGCSYTVSFNIPKNWEVANAVVIKINGTPCGGANITPVIDPTPSPNTQTVYPPAGYISNVVFSNKSASFKYNLKNANNPYLYIKEGNVYSTKIVAKVKIQNTDGNYKTCNYSYSSVLKPNTDYSASLYDVDAQGKANDLRIYLDFKTPSNDIRVNLIEWYFDQYTNQAVVWCNSNPIVPSDCDVTVSLYKCTDSTYSNASFQGSQIKNRKEEFRFYIPTIPGYYIFRLTWPGGESEPLKVRISR